MKIRYYFSLLSLAILPLFAVDWELISTRDVGFPQDLISPIPVTSCLNRELPNFEGATIFRGAAVEPTIAVNPVNPSNIVVAWQQDRITDSGALELGIAVSFDGGNTWNKAEIPTQICKRGYTDRISDVWLSFSADGEQLYLTSLPFNITQNLNSLDQQGVAVNVSFDGGMTWEERQLLGTSQDAFNAPNSGTLYPFDDKPSVTADPNIPENAYVVRERFDSAFGPTSNHAPTLFNRTINRGRKWSDFTIIYEPKNDTSVAPLKVNSTFNNIIAVLPNNPLINFGGSLLNFMTRSMVSSSNAGFFDIAFIRSKDLGLTWDTQASVVVPAKALSPNGIPLVYTGGYKYDRNGNITGGLGTLMRTSAGEGDLVFDVKVHPKKGYIYLVFQTTQFRSDFLPQVGITISRDGGVTWSAPVMINRTPQNAPNPQAFTPAIAITEEGDVGILYSDFRNDPKTDPAHTLSDTWLAIYNDVSPLPGSTGVGLDFVQEVPLSQPSYIAQNGPATASGVMTNGDYSFLVATDGTFYAAFTQPHLGPFSPAAPFFTDTNGDTLKIDDNFRQTPFVSVIKGD